VTKRTQSKSLHSGRR